MNILVASFLRSLMKLLKKLIPRILGIKLLSLKKIFFESAFVKIESLKSKIKPKLLSLLLAFLPRLLFLFLLRLKAREKR